jgi:hypothetical protein
MRDPKRIKPLLMEIEKQWERFPDWRFGQLIENIKRFYDINDLFYIEDDEMLKLIENFMRKIELEKEKGE